VPRVIIERAVYHANAGEILSGVIAILKEPM